MSSKTHPDGTALDVTICDALENSQTDLVVLAGYMKKLGPRVLSRFENRIINVHPSLLPKHGGKGLYGTRVHEAVIAAGEKVSGATVHFVNAEYDKGDILRQESIELVEDETADSLSQRVHKIEYRLLLETIDYFSQKT